jgi:peptide/nickel transport system permease protein
MADAQPLSVWFRLKRNPRVLFGGAVCLLLLLAAVFAPWLAPQDPGQQELMASFEKPLLFGYAASDASLPNYWLGSDNLGRDVLSRLIHGARIAMLVAVISATLAALLGTLLGALAGFYGGRIDSLISRMVDVWMSFPPVLLSIVLVSVLGTGLWSVIAAIVIVDWTRFCRVVRAETQAQAALDYVVSARMLGMRSWQILWHEVRPNVMPLLITLFTLEMGVAIVVEAILSFVGLSLSSGAATWGGILGVGRLFVNQAPWLMVFPMLLMMLAVLGLNALGDGLRREFDPVMTR